MRKIIYPLSFVLVFACNGYGQKLPRKDSLEILSQLMFLLNTADKPVSFAIAGIAAGNRLFSVKNYALNAKQANTNVVIYTPTLGYFHKTGFGLTAGVNLFNDITGFGINQYYLSPSFDLTGNRELAFGISYTHYFVKNKFSPFSSPIQNDLYASVAYKKTWIRPGVAAGYSAGEYREAKYKDTIIAGAKRHLYDSVTYQLNAFSVTIAAGHQFLWYGVLTKADGLGLTTTLMANAGSGRTTIHHNTNALALFNFLSKRGRIPKFKTYTFEVQSIGLNISLNYAIGAFNFEPQLYMDYYLPVSDTDRYTQVFVFNVSYSL